eukprot:1456588-Pleurochrysis_carterae.AAC.2
MDHATSSVLFYPRSISEVHPYAHGGHTDALRKSTQHTLYMVLLETHAGPFRAEHAGVPVFLTHRSCHCCASLHAASRSGLGTRQSPSARLTTLEACSQTRRRPPCESIRARA